MVDFELVKKDGLSRICKLTTASGSIETPALLPVINPKINTVTPRELKEVFGFGALITNSYIIKKHKDLNEQALAEEIGRASCRERV